MPESNDEFMQNWTTADRYGSGTLKTTAMRYPYSSDRILEIIESDRRRSIIGWRSTIPVPGMNTSIGWTYDLSQSDEGLLMLETFLISDEGETLWINPTRPSWKSPNIFEDAENEAQQDIEDANYPQIRIGKWIGVEDRIGQFVPVLRSL